MFELIDGQHTLGDCCRIEPVNVVASIKLIKSLQIIPALQGQNRAFAIDPTLGLERFVVVVRRSALTPGFILRESLGGLRISGSRGAFITLAHRQFGPQPPSQAAIAGVFEEGLGTGVVTLLIIDRRQTIRVIECAPRAALQEFDQFLFIGRLITERPTQSTDQGRRDQLLHRFALEQFGQLIVRHR